MRNTTVSVNLSRSSFLRFAMRYIAGHAHCSKADIVNKDWMCYTHQSVPSRTKAYRYSALDKLIVCGYVRPNFHSGRYHLVATDLGLSQL